MNYKDLIIRMIEEIEDDVIIKIMYKFISRLID